MQPPIKVLVTGAYGFLGQNLCTQLAALPQFEILRCGRQSPAAELAAAVGQADFVCHFAGVNRPDHPEDFTRVNTDFTETLCRLVEDSRRRIPIIFASSVHAERDNPFGRSKLEAEHLLLRHAQATGTPVFIFRLPHVIGKWCRPDYNSVVATFCHKIAHDLPIDIHDPDHLLTLVYIDHLVDTFVRVMRSGDASGPYCTVAPSYPVTVGTVADRLRFFRAQRHAFVPDFLQSPLDCALYATYSSYVPPESFSCALLPESLPALHQMEPASSAFGRRSRLTAGPGAVHDSHYHHSRVERYVITRGTARFRFRHYLTRSAFEVVASADHPCVVQTAPGWVHDLSNIGRGDMTALTWESVFSLSSLADTIPCER